jgi:hypothetical protein
MYVLGKKVVRMFPPSTPCSQTSSSSPIYIFFLQEAKQKLTPKLINDKIRNTVNIFYYSVLDGWEHKGI